jgi:hypothetical protein
MKLLENLVRHWLAFYGAVILGGVLIIWASAALAQHNHAQGHADYSGWASAKTSNCCNNQDCGDLDDNEWREGKNGTEILVLDTWCPLLQEHYIIKGKSPNWESALGSQPQRPGA